MQPLESMDVNFKIDTNIDKNDIQFYSVLQAPFSVHGLLHENGKFRRMPEQVAKTVSPGVEYFYCKTSGGRVRFKTNSPYIAISAKMENIIKTSHFAMTGAAGFDLYVGEWGQRKFLNDFRPPFEMTNGYQSVFEFPDCQMREITLHFPLYSDVCELYIGLQKDAIIQKSTPYRIQKPVVFYGSSVTQGCCATRPGNSYAAILSNWYDFDFINLGFSGNGKGEQTMVDYIAGLDMSMFVMDYDHNSPSIEHLQQTHPNMYRCIRAAHPDIPIIMMTAMSLPHILEHHYERRDIIFQSYQDAVNSGDKNVYFWDGSKEFEPYADYGTIEGSHPNDCGFYGMADSLRKIIAPIFQK